ncbi:MAG: hypothetical protein AAGC60_07035 [Acidobacteriota bacterium]
MTSLARSSNACLVLLALLLLPACAHTDTPAPETGEADAAASESEASSLETQSSETQSSETESSETTSSETAPSDEGATETAAAGRADAAACDGGLIYDDGTLEAGYGYVPSAKWGRYLQVIDSDDLASRTLDTVCVCWLRSREVDRIEFEVVFHHDAAGRPAAEPYAKRTGVAENVPKNRASGGRFYAVDVSDVEVPEGRSWVGVRYDPSVSRFSYVCADHSPESPQIEGYQQEDRAPTLMPILGSRDPIFAGHRALMLRVKASPPASP